MTIIKYKIVILNFRTGKTASSDWMFKSAYDKAIAVMRKPSMFGNSNFQITTKKKYVSNPY